MKTKSTPPPARGADAGRKSVEEREEQEEEEIAVVGVVMREGVVVVVVEKGNDRVEDRGRKSNPFLNTNAEEVTLHPGPTLSDNNNNNNKNNNSNNNNNNNSHRRNTSENTCPAAERLSASFRRRHHHAAPLECVPSTNIHRPLITTPLPPLPQPPTRAPNLTLPSPISTGTHLYTPFQHHLLRSCPTIATKCRRCRPSCRRKSRNRRLRRVLFPCRLRRRSNFRIRRPNSGAGMTPRRRLCWSNSNNRNNSDNNNSRSHSSGTAGDRNNSEGSSIYLEMIGLCPSISRMKMRKSPEKDDDEGARMMVTRINGKIIITIIIRRHRCVTRDPLRRIRRRMVIEGDGTMTTMSPIIITVFSDNNKNKNKNNNNNNDAAGDTRSRSPAGALTPKFSGAPSLSNQGRIPILPNFRPVAVNPHRTKHIAQKLISINYNNNNSNSSNNEDATEKMK